MDMMIR